MKKQSFGKMLSFLPALAMLAADLLLLRPDRHTSPAAWSQTASQWLVAH